MYDTQATVGFLNPISFRFPNSILNSNTTPIIQIQINRNFSLFWDLCNPWGWIWIVEGKDFWSKVSVCSRPVFFFPWNLRPPSRLASATKSAKQKKLGSSGTSPFQDVQLINLDLSLGFFAPITYTGCRKIIFEMALRLNVLVLRVRI